MTATVDGGMYAGMQERPKQNNLIEGATGPWEVVIGMEVHAQVTSKSKLFSGASTEFGGEPNSHVSAGRCRHARHAAGDQRGMRARRRSAPGSGSKPRSISTRCSTGRTISIPTCRRAIRSQPVQDRRSSARARSIVDLPGGETRHRRHRAAASRAGRRQEPARPASQHVPTSISTARAWR